METKERIEHIEEWITDYVINTGKKAGIHSLVVGVSGGIDSSVVSTLCANTGMDTHVVSMPIRQRPDLHDLSMRHGKQLASKYQNVTHHVIDLTATFDEFEKLFNKDPLALANSRARLRMTALYQLAQINAGIVVGTGNKVEDFGIGFYTKYGDGGVDISPIADCLKTEVWDMGRGLGVLEEIINASPTDGLWDDGRTDEEQLGMTYPELETAMFNHEQNIRPTDTRELMNLTKFLAIKAKTQHKMNPIPFCKLGE